MFKRREEGLKKKDLELQESLIRFSKFLQENDAKRMHALKKALDERKTREEKEKEIEQLVSGYRVQLASSLLLTMQAVLTSDLCHHLNCKPLISKTSQPVCATQQSLPFHALFWKPMSKPNISTSIGLQLPLCEAECRQLPACTPLWAASKPDHNASANRCCLPYRVWQWRS